MRRFNNIWKRGIIASLVIAPNFTTLAQDVKEADEIENALSLSLNFRPRLEVRDGAFRPLASNERVAALVSDRLRLNLDYSYKNLLSVRVAPQAVSIWGQANMVQGAETIGTQFSLFETWAKLRISDSWHTLIGRQVISLDDERFFGALDWAQGGRSHDAVSVHFAKNKYEVKGFFAYNQNYKSLYGNNISNPSGYAYNPSGAYPHKWMQTVWAKFPVAEEHAITVLMTNLGFQNTTVADDKAKEYFGQTYGANYFYTGSKINAHVGGYFQGGRNEAGLQTTAYTATANIGVMINKNWNVGFGSDLISGNDVGVAQTKNNAFNPYFATGHKFYGFMDYYYAGNGHRNTGISDSYLKVNYKTEKGLSIGLVFHQFITPNEVLDTNNDKFSSNLGQEVDLTISYKINKFITIIGGYSFYATTPTIKHLKGVPNGKLIQNWAWVSLNVTPTLFKYGK